MCKDCAGTIIFESRGDGTEWEYTINSNGVKIGHMVGTTADREKSTGKVYSAQTGKWSYPDE